MPRIARGLVGDLVYHVLNRGNNKQKVFHNGDDYSTFINLMVRAKARYAVKIFAYCLMPNHFHMVLMPIRGEDLSKWMQWLMTSHVRRYHKPHRTDGHVWQGRFKSFIIQKDEHLLMALRYVEGNPVRAGLVKSAKDWPWSSHKEMIGGKACILTDKPPIELQESWDKYVDEPVTEKELERLRRSVYIFRPFWTLRHYLSLRFDAGLGHRFG